MRALRGLFCAVAITACFAPGVRADEFTKQTFLTFSGPVQLPGIVLPAGTYQFKLADPESGRRVLQVWDKDGTKLYTTLLTIPDRRLTPTDKPVVMFSERPAGEVQPIRAWFYPNESYGQEFVYPKDQARRIATASHASVLAFDENADPSAFKWAKVSRMDENGRMTDIDTNKADASTTTATAAGSASAQADTAAQSSNAQSDASLSRPAQSASAQPAQSPANMPSANRSDASAPVGTSGTTAPAAANTTSEANRDNIPSNHSVGTTGATANATGANRTGQAASGANAAAPRSNVNQQQASRPNTAGTSGTLPRTASSMTLVELLAGLSLAAAFALRVFRVRAFGSR